MTKSEARAAIRWFQKHAGLEGWTIELDIGDEAPQWVADDEAGTAGIRGMLQTWTKYRRAQIWAAVNRSGQPKFPGSGLHILFHEMVELALRDSAIENPTVKGEWFIDRMADFAETAYLAETKGKK